MVEEPPPLPATVLILIIFISYFFYIPFCVKFFLNRKFYPIDARLPFFVLLINLCTYGAAFNEMLDAIYPPYPCFLRDFLGFIPYTLGFMLYNYRLLHLLFKNKMTSNMMENKDKILELGEEWAGNWYVRHRYLIRTQTGAWFFAILTIYLVIICLLSAVLEPPTLQGKPCDFAHEVDTIFDYYELVSNMTCLIIAVILGIKIRSAPADAFWIKSEFIGVVYTAGIALGTFAVLKILGFPRWLPAIFVLVCCHFIMIFGTVWPYLLSRRHLFLALSRPPPPKFGTESRSTVGNQLSDLLGHPRGFHAFLKYLEKEFSTENLLFWDSVQRLKKLSHHDPSALTHISCIWYQYLFENAPCQITISWEIQAPLLEALNSISHILPPPPQKRRSTIVRECTTERDRAATSSSSSQSGGKEVGAERDEEKSGGEERRTPTAASYDSVPVFSEGSEEDLIHVFDQAGQHIYDLMSQDSFPRFLQSPEFEELQKSGVLRILDENDLS